MLFRAAAEARPAVGTSERVVRSRAVAVATRDLHALALEPGARIDLDLFPDARFVGLIERVERRGDDRYSWHGRLEGQPASRFDIVVEGGVMLGNVHPEGRLPYEIRYGGPGAGHVVREVAPDTTATCGVGPEQELSRARPAAPSARSPLQDSGAFVDVLVVYTDAAVSAAGGLAAMHALIQLSIDTTNTAYADSAVSHRLRLAGRMATGYDEDGTNMSGHLNLLTNDGDLVMDDIHDRRDDDAADLVALIVDDTDPPSNIYGVAWVGGDTDDTRGFSVTDQGFAASATNWTFAHETGHNMGSAHDQQSGGGTGYTSYAYGHSFTGDTLGSLRTIMARRALGGARIQRFSNPNLDFDGQPTGVGVGLPNEADNRATFALSDSNVANWRTELPNDVWVDFSHTGPFLGTQTDPFADMPAAEAAVHWGGTVWVEAGASADGAAGTLGSAKAYTVRPAGPGDATLD